MALILRIFIFLCLLSTHAVNGEAAQTTIAPRGKTVIVAASASLKVRVTIQTYEVSLGEKSTKKLHFIPSTCTHAAICSIVERITITVNGDEINVPHSMLANLANLTTGAIVFDKDNIVMLMEEGDASEYCFVKLEFDGKRIKRMSLYADDSMSKNMLIQETIYYEVIL